MTCCWPLSAPAQTKDKQSTGDTKRDRLLQEYLEKQEAQEKQKILEQWKARRELERGWKAKQPDYKTPGTSEDTMWLPSMADTLPDSLMFYGFPEDTIPDTTLRPFGFDMFEIPYEIGLPSEVADITDYILGPGDNIIIYLWGKVEKEYDLTIDRQGNVFIPKIGETSAWGMTLMEFESNVKEKLSNVYTDFRLSVSLGKIRTIRVYLTGEVKRPGAYSVTSLTTLFNAMYLAGGPTERGSLRRVKLVRGDGVEKEVDLYQFLLKGDKRGDVRLSSGDAILVPVTGPRVSITGEIMRPAIYELKGEETVSNLLEMAGGPTPKAYLDRIMLDRISPDNDERIIIDLNMNPDNNLPLNDIRLENGDELTLFPIFEAKKKVVSIGGMVKHPQQFERGDSTTILDIIKRAELQPANVYYERANLFRYYPDQTAEIIPFNLDDVMAGKFNMLLNDLDSIHIYSIDSVQWEKFVFIDGEVKNPGQYKYYENMSVMDIIFLAGGLEKDAYDLSVELARTDYRGKVTSRRIDITDPSVENIILQEDDHVFVRPVPNWFVHHIATIEGEVKFPGQYALLSRKETLYDLIKRAGGFTERAFPKGLIFQRSTIGEGLIRQNLPEIIANSQPVKEDSLGNIRKLEFITFNPENINRIIIDIAKLVTSGGGEGDITLQNNDYIYVPEIPSGISVMGAVGAEGTIKFEPKKKVDYYIKRAGNFSRQADKGALKLIKAEGQVFSGKGTLRKRVELGDAIVVPTTIKKDRDWLRIISQVVTIMGGVATTIYVLDKL